MIASVYLLLSGRAQVPAYTVTSDMLNHVLKIMLQFIDGGKFFFFMLYIFNYTSLLFQAISSFRLTWKFARDSI